MTKTNSFVRDIYCSKCSNRFDINIAINLCSCGAPLLIDYDYQSASKFFNKDLLSKRENNIWKYKELLPVLDSNNIMSLGEGGTPLLRSRHIGITDNLFFKDESSNPTGSFKARGMAIAVSKAKELGLKKLVVPTAGNAGSALSAYSARADIEAYILMPADSDEVFQLDCKTFGATVELVEGTIKDCGEKAKRLVDSEGFFSVATLKEPYRIEGKKTMGYELAEQMDYQLPDVIIYPTGGGTGLIGMWKAFDELGKIGFIDSKRPKMVSVQAEGCAPMVRAFHNNETSATLWENPSTDALGLRVPSAVGDFLILQALRESGGTAVSVSEEEIRDNTIELATKEGIFSAPEGGAALAGYKKLIESDFIKPTDKVVVFITGGGYKYLSKIKKYLNQ